MGRNERAGTRSLTVFLPLSPRRSDSLRQARGINRGMPKRRPKNIMALRVEPPWPALEPDEGLTFWDIRRGECRWPLNEIVPLSDFGFCALPVVGGSSWCAVHKPMAFAKAARPDERSQRRPQFAPPRGAERPTCIRLQVLPDSGALSA